MMIAHRGEGEGSCAQEGWPPWPPWLDLAARPLATLRPLTLRLKQCALLPPAANVQGRAHCCRPQRRAHGCCCGRRRASGRQRQWRRQQQRQAPL